MSGADARSARGASPVSVPPAVQSSSASTTSSSDLAETVAGNAPLAVRAAKRVCAQSAYGDLSTVLEYGTEVTTRLFETADAAEGIRAFVDGDEPAFEGR